MAPYQSLDQGSCPSVCFFPNVLFYFEEMSVKSTYSCCEKIFSNSVVNLTKAKLSVTCLGLFRLVFDNCNLGFHQNLKYPSHLLSYLSLLKHF